MTLEEFIESLDEKRQYELAIELTKKALPIWDAYAISNKLEYVDTVVGMHHTVQKYILLRTLDTVQKEILNPNTQKKKIKQLREEFSDPIVAMQDLDWELPYCVERVFYSIRNLLDKLSGQNITVFDESQIYVVINQAIDALYKEKILTENEIKEILNKYKNGTQHAV